MPRSLDFFSQQLNTLFLTISNHDGKLYTQEEVIQGCHGELTRVYLWKLRTGKAKNPSFAIVCALADFFGVDVGYFAPLKANLSERIQAAENPLVHQLYARAVHLDNDGLRAILHILDVIDEYRSEKDAGDV